MKSKNMVRKVLSVLSVSLLLMQAAEAKKPVLKFNEDGKFKIVQFTDTHIGKGGKTTEYRGIQADKTFDRISRVIRHEGPDFVVFTGDIVTAGDAVGCWNRLMDTISVLQVPFCVVYGNHDPEAEISREDMSKCIASAPYSLNLLDKSRSLADVQLEVLSSKGDRPSLYLYCMDSHDYSTIEYVDGYGWFTPEQVEWLRNSCLATTERNGGKVVPSLAFFHICLPEYVTAWDNGKNTRKGRSAENECPAALNTGMYAAMVQTGSVMGTFVGHDHDNDYVVAENGIALGYGRYSGDDSTYNNLRPGARIIVVEEGNRAFQSWILEDDLRVVDKMTFENGKIK